MKANAPEKIYVDSKAIGDDISTTVNTKRQDYPTCTEYTRTDAFIEKACEWIEKNMDDYIYVEYDTATGRPTNEAHIAHKRVVEDFVNYMEG